MLDNDLVPRRSIPLLAMLVLGLGPRVGTVPAAQVGESAQAEVQALFDSTRAALETGELAQARVLAERLLRRAPDDPQALIARGRVYLDWPRVGRFDALRLFRRAARRAPDDPEPHYWIGRAGLALLGDDGEAIARRGLERALALDPFYRDAWELWRRLYRSPADRARMVESLRPHAADPRVPARLALLWVENGECGPADSALAELERGPSDPRWPAWRAECAFIEERDEEGLRHYERAIALAAGDTSDALWAQVASIARPEDRATYVALAAAVRPDFYRAFWALRDPNVRTAENERIAEHFRRRAQARDRFRLLHPLSLYHYSLDYRDFVSRVSRDERRRYAEVQLERGRRIAAALSSSAALSSGEALLIGLRGDRPDPEMQRLLDRDAGFRKPDLVGISPEILPLGRNLPDMIDDRGLVYVRHGPPERTDFKTLDVEEWAYESEPELRLRFDRGWYPPDPPLPDMLYRPLTGAQARSVAVAMTSDRSSLPAPLEFDFWFARFRNRDDPQRTDLLVFPEARVAATGVLWDGAGRELARDSAAPGASLELTSPAGSLLLALDVERSDSLGRYRGVIELPDFGPDGLALSDVLVAPAIDARRPTRGAVAAAAYPSLAVPFDQPFTVYLEVYGLQASERLQRFEVTYEFERQRGWLARLLGGTRTIALRFERTVAEARDGVAIEAVQIDAAEFTPGSCELSVQVRDLISGGEGTSRAVTLRLRE